MNSFQELVQSIDWGSLTDALLRVLGVFLCLTVHETCHGLAAYALGDPTAKREHRLSLNPLHHIDWFGLAAMLPAINMLMVLGIVALPGMMSGQILAGESPLIAVRYQLLICFSIAATAAIVTWVSIQMTQKLYFTKDDQFIRTQDSGD